MSKLFLKTRIRIMESKPPDFMAKWYDIRGQWHEWNPVRLRRLLKLSHEIERAKYLKALRTKKGKKK